ncbi:MAG: hypothetical protein GY794_08350 [bacterium]|nr:hypothetical protein [bacterium]
MKNNECKRGSRLVRVIRRVWAPLASGLIVMSVMSLIPRRGESASAQIGDKNGMPYILAMKDQSIARADQLYSDSMELADRNYEQSLLKARTNWSGKVTEAKTLAVMDLKTLGTRLASGGRVGETIEVLKAVYSIMPDDKDALKGLRAAGVDLDSIPPERDYHARKTGKQASKIVIWNTHNSRHNTSGALKCNVVLFDRGKSVWRVDNVDLPWKKDADTYAVVNAPPRQFDVVRVEITKWKGYSGGLAEIEVWKGGKNIALRKPARASASADKQTMSARVTDGITSSVVYKKGYWLLPDSKSGWVEVSLARPAYEKLYRAKISARKPWRKMFKVFPGDIIDITASGKWMASPLILAGPNGGIDSGSDKWGKFRDRFYLQGRLGEEVFKIGSKYTLRIQKAGELELGMNETKAKWFENNSGYLNVTLSIRKRSKSSFSPKGIASTSSRRSID